MAGWGQIEHPAYRLDLLEPLALAARPLVLRRRGRSGLRRLDLAGAALDLVDQRVALEQPVARDPELRGLLVELSQVEVAERRHGRASISSDSRSAAGLPRRRGSVTASFARGQAVERAAVRPRSHSPNSG